MHLEVIVTLRFLKICGGMLIAASLLLGACLPEPLEVRGLPTVKSQIVISSQIIPDQFLVVFVTRTFGALEASDDSDPEQILEQIAVNDAVVTLQYANISDTLVFIDNGTYITGGVTFTVGQEYILKVDSETLGVVMATTEARPQVKFEEVTGKLYFDGYDDTLAQITYSFIDPPENNWYMINALHIDTAELRSNLLNPRDFTRLLNDDEIKNNRYEETFRIVPREFSKGDTVAIYFSNISEEYYDYMKMRMDNRFGFFEFLSEPLNYPSNVKGGRGFFNLYIPDIEFIVLE